MTEANATAAMLEVIDFVEEYGGSLSGEERTELIHRVQHYSSVVFGVTLATVKL